MFVYYTVVERSNILFHNIIMIIILLLQLIKLVKHLYK